MRKQVPPDRTNSVLEFATKRPNERLESICSGISVCLWCAHPAALLTIHPKVLDYGQSEYVRQFGMTVADQPLRTQARVINAPILKYHQSSKQPIAVGVPSFLQRKPVLKNFARDHGTVHGICKYVCLSWLVSGLTSPS